VILFAADLRAKAHPRKRARDVTSNTWIAATGLISSIASITVGVSDLILLYENRLTSGVDLFPMSRMPLWRLRWGGVLGALAVPFTSLGVWQVYQGLAPAGPGWALGPSLLLAYFLCLGSTAHMSFAYIGVVLKARDELPNQSEGWTALQRAHLAQRSLFYPVALVDVMAVAVGSAWFSAAVLFNPTLYPAWFGFLNPFACGAALFFSEKWLPRRIATVVRPAFVHFVFTPFIVLSSVLLWDRL
jgi:hypothetical protein